MPLLIVRAERWAGIADNSEFPAAGADAPSPWMLRDQQLLDGRGWDLQRNRASSRPSQLGATQTPTAASIRALLQATGQGYDKPLFLTGGGQAYHYTAGAWAQAGTDVANAGTGLLQAANGMGVTLLPFGGTSALMEYDGSTITAVGGEAPTGLVCVYYHRLANRFLAFKDGEDLLRYSALNNRTLWTTGGGSSEFIGNDREPLTALARGPGDYTTVGKKDSLYVIEKTSPANWNIRLIGDDRGIAGMHGWARGPAASIFFAHESGLWVVNAVGEISAAPLSYPIRRAWKNRLGGNPTRMTFTSLAYDANEEELWVLLPTSDAADTGLGELWRMYVPDGSWMLEDTATSPLFFSQVAMLRNPTTGLLDPYVATENDTANQLKVWQLGATGARSGAFIRVGPYPRVNPQGGILPPAVYDFGVAPEIQTMNQRVAFVLAKERGTYNVQITPTLWLDDGSTVAGTAQTFSLAGTAGRGIVLEVVLPETTARGLDLRIENLAEDNIFDVEAVVVPYTLVALGQRGV